MCFRPNHNCLRHLHLIDSWLIGWSVVPSLPVMTLSGVLRHSCYGRCKWTFPPFERIVGMSAHSCAAPVSFHGIPSSLLPGSWNLIWLIILLFSTDGISMLEHVSNTLFSSILYRPLGCCLSEEVLSLLQRAAVRQKLAVGHFRYFRYLDLDYVPSGWIVACSMASAGFAACMGGTHLRNFVLNIDSNLYSIARDGASGKFIPQVLLFQR